MKKLINVRTLTVLILLLAVVLLLRNQQARTEWLDGWSYRETIYVKEKSGTLLKDYQVRIELKSDYFEFNLCKENGDDIRFTDEEGSLLSYWIEKWPSENIENSSAVIWVRLPQLKPYEEKKIYMYYGNSQAISYSNLTSTMDFIEVIKAKVSTEETTIPFAMNHNLVLASPPLKDSTEPVAVLTYHKEGGLRAVLTSHTLNTSSNQEAEVYFLGANQGFYKLSENAFLNVEKGSVDAITSNFVKQTPTTILSDSIDNYYWLPFSSIMIEPPSDMQERFLYLKYLKNLSYGSSLVCAEEADNTTITLDNCEITNFRFLIKEPVTTLYDASANGYSQLYFLTTETVSKNLDLSADKTQPVFVNCQYNPEANLIPQLHAVNSVSLDFINDPADFKEVETSITAWFTVFLKEGVFVVSKAVLPEPEVSISRISGMVFEDKNLNFTFDPDEDLPISNVKVRLYEDVNENGRIDVSDTFILESQTSSDGWYNLPGKPGHRYLIAVSALSAGRISGTEKLPYELIPEQTCVAAIEENTKRYIAKPGGENPDVSDYWSEDPDPAMNVYEHVISADLSGAESLEGLDIGFCYTLVTVTADSDLPSQGSLRQAIYNSNWLGNSSKIAFYLSKEQRGYNEPFDNFEITLRKELPPVSSAVKIAGSNLNKEASDSKITISAGESFIDCGLKINSPNVSIENLEFVGFNRGIFVDVPQLEARFGLNEAEPVSNLRILSDEQIRNPVFSATEKETRLTIPLSYFDPVLAKQVIEIPLPQGISEISLLKSIKETKNIENGKTAPSLFRKFSAQTRQTALFSGKDQDLWINGARKTLLKKQVKKIYSEESEDLTLESAFPFDALNENGVQSSPASFKGTEFTVPLKEGEICRIYSETTTSLSIKDAFSEETITTSTTGMYEYTASQNSIAKIDSTEPVWVFLDSGRNKTPVPPASNIYTGITLKNLHITASEKTLLTAYVKFADGTLKTIEKTFDIPGSYDIYEAGNIDESLRNEPAAILILSSKPVYAFTVQNERITPLVPHNLLSNRYTSELHSRVLLVSSYITTRVKIDSQDFTYETTLVAGPYDPGFIIIDRELKGFEVSSQYPISVFFIEDLTGDLYLPCSNKDGGFKEATVSSDSSFSPFNSQIKITKNSFIGCNKGIVVSEGIAVTASENRFIGNLMAIDLNDDGKDEPDDLINIDQPNLGVDSPVVTSAVYLDGTLTVSGYVGVPQSSTFDEGIVEVYLSTVEGNPRMLLGKAEVKNGTFTLVTADLGFKPRATDHVMATFTFKDGSTSEFSRSERIDPAPVISNVEAVHIYPLDETSTESGVTTITWITDIPATSKVIYDTTSHSSTETYTFETTETTDLVTTHTVVLTGLKHNTIYYFRVISKNEYGDQAISYEYVIPPGRAEADTDLCAACHRGHTGVARPLLLPYARE